MGRAPSTRRSIAGRREHYYSLFVTFVVKIILFVFLWMLFISSIEIMRTGFREIPAAWRAAFPATVAITACLMGICIYLDINEIRRYGEELEEDRATDCHP